MIFELTHIPYLIAVSAFLAALLGAGVCAIFLITRYKKLVRSQLEESQRVQGVNNQERQALELKYVSLESKQEALVKKHDELSAQNRELVTRLESEVHQRHQAIEQKKVVEAQFAEREAGFRKQIQQFEEQKQILAKEFELLANKIFEEKGKRFEQQSRVQLDSALKPFREQIDGFQKRVNEVHTESVQGNSKLEAQIKNVLDIGLKMSGEAQSLAQALKGDKKAQGNWSEVQAELLLEMAGLSEGREYQREQSLKTDDGRDQRPDFVVNLPNDKHIIIDSKISLNAFEFCIVFITERFHVLANGIDMCRYMQLLLFLSFGRYRLNISIE